MRDLLKEVGEANEIALRQISLSSAINENSKKRSNGTRKSVQVCAEQKGNLRNSGTRMQVSLDTAETRVSIIRNDQTEKENMLQSERELATQKVTKS